VIVGILLLVILALLVTVIILNIRVEHDGAPLKVIALQSLFKRKRKFFG